MLLPSVQAREVLEQQQRVFTQGLDPLFVGYSAVACFHSSEIKMSHATGRAELEMEKTLSEPDEEMDSGTTPNVWSST